VLKEGMTVFPHCNGLGNAFAGRLCGEPEKQQTGFPSCSNESLLRRSGVRVTPGARLRSGARFKRMQCWLVRVFVLLAICSAVPAGAAESFEQTIAFLLHRIETADATFIRNGQAHTPQEAVAHVRAKYEHFKTQIKTPEDFIRLAATKSLLTGQPYLVRTHDGKEMPLNTWLSNALREHRENEAR
jgi:Family of unknown function (DUF5329)